MGRESSVLARERGELVFADGLTEASEVAILSANYIAHRLRDHFEVLYTGRDNTVAHECIIDIRPIKGASGISEEDVAKIWGGNFLRVFRAAAEVSGG